MTTINLPTRPQDHPLYADRHADPAREARRQELPAHRLCGRPCRRRSAGRQRSVADAGDRLGAHARLPPPALGSRPRRCRSDGHGAARHGPRLARGAELIRRALSEAAGRKDALIACGAGTDHLTPGPDVTIDTIIRAYEEQIETVEAAGGRIILMASRALAAAAKAPDDYVRVYDRILRQVKEPVDHPLARRDVRSGARGLLGQQRPHRRRWTSASTSSRPMPTRSTASRSRCSPRRRRSPCAAGCRRASACIPATISTMPN